MDSIDCTTFRKQPLSSLQYIHAPRYQLNMYSRQAFAVDGPYVGTELLPGVCVCSVDSFKHLLKDVLVCTVLEYSAH